MSEVPNFKKFVIESDDDAAELRAMGFKSDREFEDRLSDVIDDFYSDEEVQRAIQTLRDRADQFMEKHQIDLGDDEDEREWQQRVDWTYENSIDDVGWFEFVTMVAV
jgi:hypothetical protein